MADSAAAAAQGAAVLGATVQHRPPALKALTSLRFFAALHVVLYHLSSRHTYARFPLLGRFVMSGYTGVSLFFVLSGFILAYNYREVKDRREFWISRFARIYPVYLLALLPAFVYSFAPATPRADHLWVRFALTATLLQSWYQPFAESFNGPGWTLSVEAFFYAVFPFVAGWMARMTRGVFALCCAVYVAALCAPLAASSPRLALYTTWSRLPPMHLPMLLIGAYLGGAYLRAGPDAKERQGLWCLTFGGAASSLLLFLAPSELEEPIRRGLLALAYAALICGLATVRRGWLTNRWMVLAGDISFSVYILQMPVMRTVLAVTRRLGVGYCPGVAAVLVTLLPLSYLTFRFVELPARTAIRNRLTRVPVVLERI